VAKAASLIPCPMRSATRRRGRWSRCRSARSPYWILSTSSPATGWCRTRRTGRSASWSRSSPRPAASTCSSGATGCRHRRALRPRHPPRRLHRERRLACARGRGSRRGRAARGCRLDRRQGGGGAAVVARRRRHPRLVRGDGLRPAAALVGRPDLQAGHGEGILGQHRQQDDGCRDARRTVRRAAAAHRLRRRAAARRGGLSVRAGARAAAAASAVPGRAGKILLRFS
jgi:hypothetical protein